MAIKWHTQTHKLTQRLLYPSLHEYTYYVFGIITMCIEIGCTISVILVFCNFSGNLMTKSLNGLVKNTDVVVGSEYLQTLLVVIPKYA